MSLILLVGLLAWGCATYRDDLDRSIRHYDSRQYDKALALLVVLEPDLDSLSVSERAQYAHYRGMSHLLLEQRADARHWLAIAAAREKIQPGLLRPDEKKKNAETLAELNKERLGENDTDESSDEAPSCTADGECGAGHFCDAGRCAPLPSEPSDSAPR